jgi:hypothetical protein
MKTTVLFVATSLILVVAMLAIAVPNAVHADKPVVKWCDNNGPFCAETKKACNALLEGIAGEHKCVRKVQP